MTMRIRPSSHDRQGPGGDFGAMADEELMPLVRRADPRAFAVVYAPFAQLIPLHELDADAGGA